MPARVVIGVVTSDKASKTRRVEINRTVRHPKYKKFVKRRTVCHVHDENNESEETEHDLVSEPPADVEEAETETDTTEIVSAGNDTSGDAIEEDLVNGDGVARRTSTVSDSTDASSSDTTSDLEKASASHKSREFKEVNEIETIVAASSIFCSIRDTHYRNTQRIQHPLAMEKIAQGVSPLPSMEADCKAALSAFDSMDSV